MTLSQFLSVLERRWRVAIAVPLLVIAGAIAFLLNTSPIYQASATLFVSTRVSPGDLNQQLLQGGNFTAERVKSYTSIATSPTVLQPVIDRLSLDESSADLARNVVAEVPIDTVVINISVTALQAEDASRIANAVAEQLAVVIEDIERPAGIMASPVKATLITPAASPTNPIFPRVVLTLFVATIGGLLLGVGFALIWERLDTRVRNRSDLSRHTDIPVLGEVAFQRDSSLTVQGTALQGNVPGVLDSIDQLRVNLQFSAVDGNIRSILFASGSPAEGKTSTSSAVAVAMADAGLRTCLVDADLRRPKIAERFGLPNELGLSSVIIGKIPANRALQACGTNLSVMVSGPIPPNPSQLLSSRSAAVLFEELSSSFDVLIIDSPPLLAVPDGATLSARVDATLLVVRSGKTTGEDLHRSLSSVADVGGTVRGIVLNGSPIPRTQKAYEGYRSTTPPGRSLPVLDNDDKPNSESHMETREGLLAVGRSRPTPYRRLEGE